MSWDTLRHPSPDKLIGEAIVIDDRGLRLMVRSWQTYILIEAAGSRGTEEVEGLRRLETEAGRPAKFGGELCDDRETINVIGDRGEVIATKVLNRSGQI